MPYWQCPSGGTCVEPNQCICDAGSADPFCNRESINGPRFGEFGECSNPCKEDAKIERALGIASGEKTSECRWAEKGAQCDDVVEDCHGNREWTTVRAGSGRKSDPEECVFNPGKKPGITVN